MKPWMKNLALAAVLGCAVCAPMKADAAEMVVPEDVYEWVQSSSRMNYYFNKQEIRYGTDKSGKIDHNTLKVPVLKTYDDVQIEDVLVKRKWRQEPTDGYEDIAGEADYLVIDISKKTVTVEHMDLLDSQMWTIERKSPNETIDLEKMSDKNKDGIFFKAILEYEKKHRDEIVKNSKEKMKHKAEQANN